MQAYILIGSNEKKNNWIESFKKKINISSFNLALYEDKIKIADVRSIQKSLYFKVRDKETRLIVFQNSLTIEAQNALLKTLEELPPQVYIVLTGGNIDDFLPTVQSRCKIVFLERSTDASFSSEQLEQKLKDYFQNRAEYSKSIIIAKEIESLGFPKEQVLSMLQHSLRKLLFEEVQKKKDTNSHFIKYYSKSLQQLLDLYPLIIRNNLNLELSLHQIFSNSVSS